MKLPIVCFLKRDTENVSIQIAGDDSEPQTRACTLAKPSSFTIHPPTMVAASVADEAASYTPRASGAQASGRQLAQIGIVLRTVCSLHEFEI